MRLLLRPPRSRAAAPPPPPPAAGSPAQLRGRDPGPRASSRAGRSGSAAPRPRPGHFLGLSGRAPLPLRPLLPRRARPGARSACAGVPEPSRPQVPPPAPPSRPRGAWELSGAALGLQSFSSGRRSWNKRGGGAAPRRNSWDGRARPERATRVTFPPEPSARAPRASRAALSASGAGCRPRASPGARRRGRGPRPTRSETACLGVSSNTPKNRRQKTKDLRVLFVLNSVLLLLCNEAFLVSNFLR